MLKTLFFINMLYYSITNFLINFLLFFPANSLNQQSNSVPSLAVIASNEIPITPSRSSQSTSTATRPPFYSLNAAAAATSSTMGNYQLYTIC